MGQSRINPWRVLKLLLGVVVVLALVVLCILQFSGPSDFHRRGMLGLSHMKALNMALRMYQADNDGRFPSEMTTNAHLRGVLVGYVESQRSTFVYDADSVFRTNNPDESEFLGNGLLAGYVASGLYSPETTVTLYDSKVWQERSHRNVGFTDGHQKFVPESVFVYGLKAEQLFLDSPEVVVEP